jgi:hypothetical protein
MRELMTAGNPITKYSAITLLGNVAPARVVPVVMGWNPRFEHWDCLRGTIQKHLIGDKFQSTLHMRWRTLTTVAMVP